MMTTNGRKYVFADVTGEVSGSSSYMLSAFGFVGTEPDFKNYALVEFLFKEPRRFITCSMDRAGDKAQTTESPTVDHMLLATFDQIASKKPDWEAAATAALGLYPFAREEQDRLREALMRRAEEVVREAMARRVETLSIKMEVDTCCTLPDYSAAAAAEAEEKKMSGDAEAPPPEEMCMMCLAELRPDQAAKRLACGHVYHDDCTEYYDVRGIACAICYHTAVKNGLI